MRRLMYLASLCLALSFLGLGCKEPSYNGTVGTDWRGVIQDPPKSAVTTLTTPVEDAKPFYDVVIPVPPEVSILRQAMRNLVSAKSFKATITLPPGEGQSTPTQALLAFNRDQGFRGVIAITPELKSEIHVIDEQVYFRANTSSWQNVSDTREGLRLRAFFQVAFPNKLGTKQILVSDSARIEDIRDDKSGCRQYTYTEVVPGGDIVKTIACIKDGFPTFIINEYAEGNTEVRYSDINQPIDTDKTPQP